MNKAMKENNACDHAALYASLKRMKISATARRIGEFMVDKLGYDYAVMVFQLKTALGIRPDKIVAALQELIDQKVTFETFFKQASLNPNASLITGVICGYRVEEIDNPLTQKARYLDKLVDELAKGRKMEKILRVA